VNELKTWNPLELCEVVGHQRGLEAQGMGGALGPQIASTAWPCMVTTNGGYRGLIRAPEPADCAPKGLGDCRGAPPDLG